MIDTLPVKKAFKKIGVDVNFVTSRPFRRTQKDVTVDVQDIRGKETFIVSLPSENKDREKIEVTVMDSHPKMKHLLLLVRNQDTFKYLCGHDERHWFVSAVKGNSVMEALQGLKPQVVQSEEKKAGVRKARKHKHHTKAWIRQGEWFFIPAPDFNPDDAIIWQKEPINRSNSSKPHMCDELIRRKGQIVWVSRRYPNGISEEHYNDLLKSDNKIRGTFQARTVDAEVYVRGKIRHPDHKTVDLKGWHKVIANSEVLSSTVRFLD